MTTFPFEHSTPNHEQGSISAPLPSQFDNAPKGSLTTLSRNLNSAKPVHSYNSLSLFFVQFKSLPETLRTCKGKVYVYIYIYIYLRCWETKKNSDAEEIAIRPPWTPPCLSSNDAQFSTLLPFLIVVSEYFCYQLFLFLFSLLFYTNYPLPNLR